MKNRLAYRITWFISPNEPLRAASKMLTGLTQLQAEGHVSLRFAVLGKDFVETPIGSSWEVVEVCSAHRRNVFLDFHDSADTYNPDGMSFADVYFKRSYSRTSQRAFSRDGTAVLPYGLNFSCLTTSARIRLLQAIGRRTVAGIRHRHRLYQIRSDLLNSLKLLRNLPTLDDFYFGGTAVRLKKAVFQTRIWPPEESEDNLPELNRERIELARTLKSTLQDRFMGGVSADSFSETQCPDILVTERTHRLQYIRDARSVMVGVYSRGVHHSIGFKFAEYLAAGQCIVSCALVHELPQPIQPNVHYLPYTSAQECATQCELLLSNADLRRRMSSANVDYYSKWVEPRAHVADILSRAFTGGADAR